MSIDGVQLLSDDGAIARRLDGYELRPQQLEMTAAVDRTLKTGERLLVEAGTGIGKSFAYLLPAIKRIVEHRERIVICTNTISLQEQLLEKDIPKSYDAVNKTSWKKLVQKKSYRILIWCRSIICG